MDKLATFIRDAVYQAAMAQKSFDTGTVTSVDDQNSPTVTVSGAVDLDSVPTSFPDVPQGGQAPFQKFQTGDSLLIINTGGPSNIAHIGPSPFVDGPSYVFDR